MKLYNSTKKLFCETLSKSISSKFKYHITSIYFEQLNSLICSQKKDLLNRIKKEANNLSIILFSLKISYKSSVLFS